MPTERAPAPRQEGVPSPAPGPVARDDEGYFLDPATWDESIALRIADEIGIVMTERHWRVVRFVRAWYENRGSVPEARHAVKSLLPDDPDETAARRSAGQPPGVQAAIREMFTLFPYGYGQQACKIAGMRKPLKLMLDL